MTAMKFPSHFAGAIILGDNKILEDNKHRRYRCQVRKELFYGELYISFRTGLLAASTLNYVWETREGREGNGQ